jgi:hypothetical protein
MPKSRPDLTLAVSLSSIPNGSIRYVKYVWVLRVNHLIFVEGRADVEVTYRWRPPLDATDPSASLKVLYERAKIPEY